MTRDTAGCLISLALGALWVGAGYLVAKGLGPALGSTDLAGWIGILAGGVVTVAVWKIGDVRNWIRRFPRGPTPKERQRAAIDAELRKATKGGMQEVVVRTYTTGFGGAEKRGLERYEREARALGAMGYAPTHSAAAEKASWAGAKVGSLTVTYRLETEPPRPSTRAEATPDIKVCPDCAEGVQAAARVCRFCRFDFTTRM